MSLGQQFREARERKGVSIPKAAEDTKIKTETLRALEADDYSSMPAPVYAKGFVKMYAQYLGLDPNTARQEYEELSGEKKAAPGAPPIRQAATHYHASPVNRILSSVATMWGMWLLVGGIIVVLVLIVWIVVAAAKRPRTSQAKPKPVAMQTTSSVAPPRPEPPPAPAASTSTAPPGDSSAYIRPVQPRAGILDTGKSDATPKGTAVQPAPAAPLTLVVRLTEECWLEVVLDGKTTLRYGVQKPGWEKEWRAQKSILLKAGNAAGVKAKLNGQELPSLGKRGQRVTKTYTK